MLLLIHFLGDEVRSKVTEMEKQMDKEKKQMEKKDGEKKEMEKEMEKNEKENDKDTSVIRQQSKLLTVLEIFVLCNVLDIGKLSM